MTTHACARTLTHTHIRAHRQTHTHALYIMIDYGMPPMHRFITCTKFVIMKRFNFLFFSDSCLCVSDRIPKVSRKDNACSSLRFFPLFLFFYRHLLR